MRKGGGKAKGASFERDVCQKLSLWVSRGKVEDVFWRSAMSGGRSTVAARKGKRFANQAGDISAVHAMGQFFLDAYVVECKHYKDLQLDALTFAHKGVLAEFWKELRDQAFKLGKRPLLIAKQNNRPCLVISNTRDYPFEMPLFEVQSLAFYAITLTYFLTAEPDYVVNYSRLASDRPTKGQISLWPIPVVGENAEEA